MYRITILAMALGVLISSPMVDAHKALADSSLFHFDSAIDTGQSKDVNVPESCQVPKVTAFDACKKNGDVIIGGNDANEGCKGEVTLRPGTHSTGKITINTGGTLIVADEAASGLQLSTTGIDIVGGSLLIGSADCPIGTIRATNKVTVRFTGKRPTTCGDLSQPNTACPGYVKGIQVGQGGTLKMYGRKGVPGAAPVSRPAIRSSFRNLLAF
jgi:hypothetical protein